METMLERNIIVLISAVTITLICWMIVENRFCSFGSLSKEKALGTFRLRWINISVEKFFDAVNTKKDFRTPRLEKEMGKVQLKSERFAWNQPKKGRESNYLKDADIKKMKRYNRKEDM